MPSSPSSIFRLELQATGENDTTWGTKTNTNLQLIEQGAAQWTNVNITGSGDYTLTATDYTTDESRSFSLNLTGLLTGNRTVIAPAVGKPYIVVNNTTGAFTVSIKPVGGASVTIPQGGALLVAVNTSAAVAAVNRVGLGLGTASLINVGTSVTEIPDVSIADARYIRVNATVSAALNLAGTVNVTGALNPSGGVSATGQINSVPVTATFSTSTSLNFSLGNNFIVSVSSAGTFTQPSNLKAGQSGFIWIYMTTAAAIAYTSGVWAFSNRTVPINSTSVGSVNVLAYAVRANASTVDATLLTNVG